jgi:hypothetical protein
MMIAASPVGRGQSEREVSALQGEDRPRGQRWRSPRRWQRLYQLWWPSHAHSNADRLLMQFNVEAHGPGMPGIVRRAIYGHVLWGAVM